MNAGRDDLRHSRLVVIRVLALLAAMFVGACVPGRTVLSGDLPRELTGILDGAIVDGSECIWLSGEGGERTYLLLPPRVAVKFNPLILVDWSGSTIARGGDVVAVSGTGGRGGFSACSAGAIPLAVDTITTTTSAS
jgi:hypothetical protein